MKKHMFPIILILFCMLCHNVFADTPYAFEYVKTGKGDKTIIFIPGFACSGEVWNETKKSFEKNYTCYTLTMAGFAGVPPGQQARFNEWSASIAKFIRDQKIVKPILVGHSMGGGLVMDIASKHPDLIDRIVVVDALPCLGAMQNPEFKSVATPDCSAMIKQMTQTSEEDFYKSQKQIIASMVADTGKHEQVVGWGMKTDRKTSAEMFCDFSNTDLRESIKSISCPALILLESYFINFKPAIESQYLNLKGAQLRYANKGLHFIMFDDPKWYMDQLEAFIN